MTYNTTLLENGTNPVEIVEGINIASGGILMPLILLAVFVISLIVFKNYETRVALVTSSLVTTFLAGLMLGLGWLPIMFFVGSLAIFMLSLVWLALADN